MNRLPAILLALLLSVGPAAAEVCEKLLGSDFDRLLHASVWRHVGDRLLSPLTLGLIALAILTATRFPRLRGMALIAGLVAAVKAVTALGDNVFPDRLMLSARLEGCGEASIAGAVVAAFLAALLLGAFLWATDSTAREQA
ncbi:hypothetical protein [Microvirga antarctica]|uniref:hypothetical protein n=1 Tax=Microvirga antarctica TaxID=2819233 RepID=UPI001B31630B|nr:hypothetical protein [Microvirga antarctica]